MREFSPIEAARERPAVLFATTFWNFLREFSPLEAARRDACLFR